MRILLEQTHNATLMESRGTAIRFIIKYGDVFYEMRLSETLSKQRRYCKALITVLARYDMDLTQFGFTRCGKEGAPTHRDRHANFHDNFKALKVIDA